jgi:DNA modification methylase
MSTAIPSKLAESIELWDTSALQDYADNPREHTPDQIRRIAASISKFGFIDPIIVDRKTREIIAGHGSRAAAALLGLPRVPVIPIEHLSEAERHAFVVAHNRLAELSAWNDDKLRAVLGKLQTALPDLPELGFNAPALRRLLAPERATPAEIDATKRGEEIEHPATKTGDVWILGEHRIACGDCREDKVRRAVLGERLADAVVTDPPYAIFGSSTGVGSDVADDRMVRDFFTAVLRAIASSLKLNGHGYTFCDWRSYPTWFDCARGGTGLVVANCLVWNKRGGLGSNWQNAHELIAFFHRVAPSKSMWKRGPRGGRPIGKPNVLQLNRAGVGGFEGGEKGTEDTVTEHNAAKPVDLLRELVSASTEPGERVLDLFAGSGSTLLACELSRRVGLGIDVEPRWCDVTVDRWQRLTGKAATLEADGRTFAEVAAARLAAANGKQPRRRRAARG